MACTRVSASSSLPPVRSHTERLIEAMGRSLGGSVGIFAALIQVRFVLASALTGSVGIKNDVVSRYAGKHLRSIQLQNRAFL